ncbi:MDR family MFS transporter [Ectobacillus ponti]|uniref:MFS transporter n=1 Tax=Ectobacillus ponti TaxID=2961894 RepID=A0AA41X3M2_9BACI|nr:MDR family MFS transporter [Ectobacillus ponti]MCP8968331.1 MFS transporter [Ectobacillus ponti]
MVTKESNLKLVVAGLLLGIFMAAMDNTIVATAMGTIIKDLGGLDKFVWVTSAYMVAVMAGMPIFGKLSDMYGRKRFFIFGLLVFLLGSALCGIAQSIVQLSVYRAIQGIGGGALMPIAFTIIFDVFPPEKRGKMTGLFGAVFGLSSVAGPLLGAYITEYISWHWVFYVNVPIGLVSLFMISKFYKESKQHRKQKIDWGGAITLVVGIVSLMFALELGGKEYAWNSTQIISLLSVFGVFFLAFLYIETKASEPIISFWMFKKRIFATSQVLGLLYGATFVILTVYIPIFVQAVYGGSATNAGLILTPLMLGSVAGSGFGGAFQTKMKFRSLMLISIVAYIIGFYLLSTLTPDTPRWMLTVFMILAGFGTGFSFSLLPSASVHGLAPQFRGSANSTNSFFRSLGMTLGITIFGTIQSNTFTDKLKEAFAGMGGGFQGGSDARTIFEASQRAKIPAPILDKIIGAMSSSITTAFTWALIPIAVAFVVVLLMGNARVEAGQQGPAPRKAAGQE